MRLIRKREREELGALPKETERSKRSEEMNAERFIRYQEQEIVVKSVVVVMVAGGC